MTVQDVGKLYENEWSENDAKEEKLGDRKKGVGKQGN